MGFALYIGRSIRKIDFIRPGTRKLTDAIAAIIRDHDAVLMAKHGLLTVGATLQEAFLKALIIERESKAQLICKLFGKKPPYLKDSEINSLTTV